jgi:hypothetical protein
VEGARVQIRLRSLQTFGHCPDCGKRSRRIICAAPPTFPLAAAKSN